MEVQNNINHTGEGTEVLHSPVDIFSERSELTQEIVSRKPDFIEKWAIPLFVIILAGLLCGTYFIRYPDVITTSGVLVSENAPKEIVPQRSGKIVFLSAHNNQKVQAGEILGWLESTSSVAEIMELKSKIDSSLFLLHSPDSLLIKSLYANSYRNLGELQVPYQAFMTSLLQYDDYRPNGFYRKKKQVLQSDYTALNQIGQKVDTTRKLTNSGNELAQKSFEMNERLFKEKVISLEEYRQAQAKLLNNQKETPQADVAVLSQRNQIVDKEKEIDQLSHDMSQQRSIFEQSLYTLKSLVEKWMSDYTLRSPSDGTLVLISPLEEGKYLNAGKIIGYVNPLTESNYVEINLPQNNFGKIDTGMKVRLRFDAYPYQEMGYVSGRIAYISQIAIDSGFKANVSLDNGLVTNMNKKLAFKNGLRAQALIITKEMRLMQKFYSTFSNAIEFQK